MAIHNELTFSEAAFAEPKLILDWSETRPLGAPTAA